jgi:inner membrane protein
VQGVFALHHQFCCLWQHTETLSELLLRQFQTSNVKPQTSNSKPLDSITHIALGAIIGEATLSKQIGKRALLLGALAQSIPDVDVVASLWLPLTKNLLAHRGFTHSFLFGILAALLIAFVLRRFNWSKRISFTSLFLFLCAQIWLHDLLDTCNAYGTGLLEPFSSERFSFHLLFVGDPFFSLSIIVAFIALLMLKSTHPARKKWLFAGLIPAAVYFVAALFHKDTVTERARYWLQRSNTRYQSLMVTPTPFNSWLWFVVAYADSGYYAGYRSVYDNDHQPLSFTWYPRNEHLIHDLPSASNLRDLVRFADGYYTVEKQGDSLAFNVLRFGQVLGWNDANARFAFRYYVHPTADNTLVVQRGRFEGWNREVLKKLYNRIKGH